VRVAFHTTLTGHHGGLPRFFQVLASAFRGAGVEVVDRDAAPDLLYAPSISFERVPPTDLPLVCTFHDAHWKHFDTFGPDGTDALEAIGAAWMREAALVCCSSWAMCRELAGFYPAEAHKLRVVHLPPLIGGGVADHAALARLRRERGLPGAFALTPAQAGMHKNHLRLFSAWGILRAAGLDPPPLVLTGMQTEGFEDPLGPLGLVGLRPGRDVLGLGYVDDDALRALYGGASMLVMPTRYDAGSFPIMEAMARGVPVVSSRIPSILEQVRRQGAWATFFDADDPVDIARAVAAALADPERGRLLARHARIAVGRESWDVTGRGYRRVFREALERRRPPRRPAGRELPAVIRVPEGSGPGAARWAEAALGLAEAVAARLGRTLRPLPPPGVVGARDDVLPELAFLLEPDPRLAGVPTVTGPEGGVPDAIGRMGFAAGADLRVPPPFRPGRTQRADVVWTRSRYALPARFALAPLGALDPAGDEAARAVATVRARGLARDVVVTGDGSEIVRADGAIGLGRVDDRELRALHAECAAVVLRPRPGPLALGLDEARRSGRPVLDLDGADLGGAPDPTAPASFAPAAEALAGRLAPAPVRVPA
jgi:glycosyltransferase involved in cell wall biosynthesis